MQSQLLRGQKSFHEVKVCGECDSADQICVRQLSGIVPGKGAAAADSRKRPAGGHEPGASRMPAGWVSLQVISTIIILPSSTVTVQVVEAAGDETL